MELHIFFLPFMAPGHTIPMLRTASLLSSLGGVKSTVLTTPINSSLLSGNSFPHLHHLLLPFPLDSTPELTELTSPFLRSIVKSTDLLRSPVDDLIRLHCPDCIVSDQLFPWTSDLAAKHGIPRLSFLTSGLFPHCCMTNILRHQLPSENLFTIPGLPHSITMKLSNLPDYLRSQPASDFIMSRLEQSEQSSYGVIVNGFDEMEPGLADYYKEATGVKVWHALSDSTIVGGEASPAFHWLDTQKPNSVVYVCFGSLGKHTPAQLREIGLGLEVAGHPFLWVVKDGGVVVVVVEGGKGIVVRGWVPQAAILNHVAVGGFVTHCGWNSVTEGVRAGVPMATWPLFAEQFFNERLVVDVLGVGVGVGAEVCSSKEEERGVVATENVRAAVEELMGGGEVAAERRRRSREMGEKARAAAEEGGSSYREMEGLIEELMQVKKARIGQLGMSCMLDLDGAESLLV